MNHTQMRTQGFARTARLLATAALMTFATAATASAAGYDVYGGRGADTQTIHHCGWVPTQRMDFAKANTRNTAIIQRKLAALGYYRAAIDGKNGPLTKAAIAKFQSENGHQLVDGIVGIETSAGLGYNTHPSPWVRGCRRPYNGEVVLRYYPYRH